MCDNEVHLRLTIDVTYCPGTARVQDLGRVLEHAACFLVDKGLLTGETDAEVQDWRFRVDAIEDPVEADCPHCGCKRTEVVFSPTRDGYESTRVYCPECYMTGPRFDGKDGCSPEELMRRAVAAWNRLYVRMRVNDDR